MKTTKILVAVIAAALIAPTFQSCKKSNARKIDGDWTVTSYSFTDEGSTSDTNNGVTTTSKYSGKQDFDGTVTTSESVDTDSNGDITTETTTATSYTVDYPAGWWSEDEVYTRTNEHEESYSFSKDGTYTMTLTDTETLLLTSYGGVSVSGQGVITTVTTETANGEWSFLGKNKSAELKANERIALHELSRTSKVLETSSLDSDKYEMTSEEVFTLGDQVWTITESKNKSLIVAVEYEWSDSFTDKETEDGITETESGSWLNTGAGTIEMTQE